MLSNKCKVYGYDENSCFILTAECVYDKERNCTGCDGYGRCTTYETVHEPTGDISLETVLQTLTQCILPGSIYSCVELGTYKVVEYLKASFAYTFLIKRFIPFSKGQTVKASEIITSRVFPDYYGDECEFIIHQSLLDEFSELIKLHYNYLNYENPNWKFDFNIAKKKTIQINKLIITHSSRLQQFIENPRYSKVTIKNKSVIPCNFCAVVTPRNNGLFELLDGYHRLGSILALNPSYDQKIDVVVITNNGNPITPISLVSDLSSRRSHLITIKERLEQDIEKMTTNLLRINTEIEKLE